MDGSGKFYRMILGVIGGLHLFTGIGFLAIMLGKGPFLVGYGMAFGLILVGAILCADRLSPRLLTHPRGRAGFLAIPVLLTLGAGGWYAGGYLGGLMQARGMANAIFLGMVPGGLILALHAIPVLPVLIALTVRANRPGGAGQGGADPHPVADRTTATTLERTHLVFLRLAGLAALAATIHGVGTRIEAIPQQVIYGGLGSLGGLVFLMPGMTPRMLGRPSRWYHFIGFNLIGATCATLPLLAYLVPGFHAVFDAAAADAAAGTRRGPAEVNALLLDSIGPEGLVAYAAIGLPLQLAWFTSIALLWQPPAADPPRVARPVAGRAMPANAPALPAIGAAMKLYVVADWIVLRLVGLGLAGTAWMLWTMIGRGQAERVAVLAHGLDPMRAVHIYAAFGALLAVPFLLPRAIAAPRHVGWGLLKAMILVFAALILISPLRVAMVTFTDKIYHATLLATVPMLFKAITGVAVTSILLIAFFRQLGTLPATTETGRPVPVLSQDDLRALRAARMGQA